MIGFGSIGGGEILLILALALLLFGPRKIPQVSRTIAKTLAEFRKASSDLKLNLEREIDMEAIRETGREIKAVRSDLGSSIYPPTKAQDDTTRPTGDGGEKGES